MINLEILAQESFSLTGTPEELVVVIKSFVQSRSPGLVITPVMNNEVLVSRVTPSYAQVYFGFRLLPRGDGGTQATCLLLDRDFEPYFLDLCVKLGQYLEELGYLRPQSGTGKTGDSGRPSKSDYDLAYKRIRNGEDQSKVYKDWVQQNPERVRELADPLDSFKKAMRNRKKREKRE